jgi:hypothetical protein
MSEYILNDFSGGSNLLDDATKLAKNEDYLIINGRCRYGNITPIKQPLQVEGIPQGNFQGCYAAGNFLVVFINGFAYYKDYSAPNTSFQRVVDFSMSATAPVIYTALVPASTVNFARVPITPNKNDPINLVGTANASPQCLVVQDGLNQPWLIMSNGTSFVSQNYLQWTQAKREYVPIGRQMLYSNGILYVISADMNGRFTQINRSVSGRPLDFMVNITSTGDKLPAESDGGARSVSYRVDYDEITALSAVTTTDGSFLVTTNRNSYLVTPDFDSTLFGEPTFKNAYLFSTGAINNFSVVDILGDTALIDFTGIRSFNAVSAIRVEGRNSPFSAKLATLFSNIVQSTFNAAIAFDNYALFSMDTIFGPAVIIYDTLRSSFVGIDLFINLGLDDNNYPARIKQYAETKTILGRRLFFITTSNKLFEYYAGETSECTLFTREFCTLDPNIELKPTGAYCIFTDTRENGTVTLRLFVDRILDYTTTEEVDKNLDEIIPPTLVTPPFGIYTRDNVDNVDFNFVRSSQGWKYMLAISWDFLATLTTVKAVANDVKMESSLRTQIKNYARFARP